MNYRYSTFLVSSPHPYAPLFSPKGHIIMNTLFTIPTINTNTIIIDTPITITPNTHMDSDYITSTLMGAPSINSMRLINGTLLLTTTLYTQLTLPI